MNAWLLCAAALLGADPEPLGSGDHTRSVKMGEQKRSYLVHVPKGYDPKKATPVVLALHGAAMNGPMMADFCGLNTKADEEGFIVIYPNGTGASILLTWNASGTRGWMGNKSDDVAFVGKVLDDLGTVVVIDKKRVYACGMSNGAMMCYRLAAEMSDRISAIAPVAGTVAVEESKPKRPVSVLHFHGTKDALVPFEGPKGKMTQFKSVEDSIQTWVKLNECPEKPKVTEELSKADDELKVTRKIYGPGKDGAEVVLVVVEGGGHTWPGQKARLPFMGKSAMNISANDLIWEFFKKHPMKE
jgi:polyhydroxybutyrate depolymerase